MSDSPVDPPKSAEPEKGQRFLEIDTSRKRRWTGLAAYILFFLIVASAVVFVFVRFAGSVGLAIVLVAFMVGYMLVMGYVAGKNAEDRDR